MIVGSICILEQHQQPGTLNASEYFCVMEESKRQLLLAEKMEKTWSERKSTIHSTEPTRKKQAAGVAVDPT